MTLNDINKALSKLTQQPSRENILEFSFMLLNWMDVSTNAESKPQLLSPQTQKLKDYLVNAPQTVQPQLYRLSADGQNIRVRFAVLKKLKKEYISQLVDNDPGLSSYQSFSKGLNLPANGTSFIPNQPYYIHFVTTADYNKLVLIFNQGEQKRIVSFRNRLTNTQYHKIIQAWQNIGVKSKPEIADLFWKSLDIKEVNKEFYRQIKERFDALIGIVKTQPSTATENQVKQFTVRMIGRYVFCWFLKEKEIIPHSLISKQAIENTDNYYQTVLLKLFFETLNTKVQDRDPAKHNKLFEKIPYLNGGLFDESEEDKLFSNLNLDEWLLPFVDILESYDFTVDESSSQYQQVAVDPEMLGRIFENLLASQNEETEKLANQRKAFGAFYTPREIVDYMVNESIKAFLQNQWEQHIEAEKTKHLNNPEALGDIFGKKKPQQLAIETKRYQLKQEEKEKIEKYLSPLFSIQPHTDGLKKEDKILLLSFLERIKILDPACGSGAFPMGILHKLLELHEILGAVKSSYELKKDILSENIYGVDIMPMAIEIARLRAWLSLVLEEDYKPNDPKHNFGVKPLPNLDFKFVCANSLIDLGLDDFIKESKGTLHEGFTKKLVTDLKDLEALRTNFFNPSLASSQKEQLKMDYLEKRDKVVSNIELHNDIILKQIAQKIKNWNPFDDSQPSSFFSPTWMFGIDKGFDVVIGNPPYSSKQSIMMKEIAKNFKYVEYKCDPYAIFIEYSTKAIKKYGIVVFITPLTWFTNHYYFKLRKYLIDSKLIKQAIMFDNLVFDSANVDTSILMLNSGNDDNFFSWLRTKSTSIDNSSFALRSFEDIKKESRYEINSSSDDSFPLLRKIIEQNSSKLAVLRKISLGMKLKGNDEYVSRKKDSKRNDAIIFGNEIGFYEPLIPTHFFNYAESVIIGGTKKKEIHNYHPKIMVQAIRNLSLKKRIVATLDTNGYYFVGTVNALTPTEKGKQFDEKYLLALINSSLLNYYFKNRFTTISLTSAFLGELPIRNVDDSFQKVFSAYVDNIFSAKSRGEETIELEREIDVLVYRLYELSHTEVKIIDKDFWLSEQEYENVTVAN